MQKKIIDATFKNKKNSAPKFSKSQGGKKSAAKKQQQAQRGANNPPVRVSFLGGLNEVGKNMTLYEYRGDMFLVDCGLSFPDPEMFGVDLVIPDFSYIERNAANIKGIVITHGHEDHIGAIPYLLKTVNIPVYATHITKTFIQFLS